MFAKRYQVAFVSLGLLIFSTPAFAGKKKHHGPEPTPTPEAQPSPSVSPDAMPSERLHAFLDAHLDKILAPLDAEGLKHPDPIVDLKSSLADGATKAPAAKQPAFQAAIAVCDALTNALNERQTAAANLAATSSVKFSSKLGEVSDVTGPYYPGDVSERQRHSEARTRKDNAQTDANFANTAKSQWVQEATRLRQNVQQLYAHERDVERQINVAVQASAVADARREAIRLYPEIAVEGSKLNAAYVARYNDYQKSQPGYFQDASWPLRLAEEVAQPPRQ